MKKLFFKTLLFTLPLLFIFSINASANQTNTNSMATVIYDKNGRVIQPTKVDTNPISPKANTRPTSIWRIKKHASYFSNGFTGSGRRYGGYLFVGNGTKKFKISVNKGGFGLYTTTTPGNPVNISSYFNLPLSGSPYTMNTGTYFYFFADNPVSGQNYHVTGE